MTIATVTSKGQVTIPADIRADFEIKAGDQIVFFKKLGGELGVHIRRPKAGSGRGILAGQTAKVAVEEMEPGSGGMRYNPGGLDLADDDEEQAA